MKLHASGEDYLETILVLQKKRGMVRSVDAVSYTHLNVEIKDVCFSYQKDTQVIRHASFTAEQGQVTALVGPSAVSYTHLPVSESLCL